jgi:UDP-2,3-diacylglucosamine pyrophosphatase LpxH
MADDRILTWQQLGRLWADPDTTNLPLEGRSYVLLSDIHLGDGGEADDFLPNLETLEAALEHYCIAGYTLILLGDIEELWQFDLEKIVERYQAPVYHRIRRFGDLRVVRVFGNHDREWGGMVDPTRNRQRSRRSYAAEGLRLVDDKGVLRFLLVHGHQGSRVNDRFSWFSRFFVRLYAGVEPVLKWSRLVKNPSATKTFIAKDFERTMYTWARENKSILICGHSHRAIFASKSYGERLQEQRDLLQAQLEVEGVRVVDRKRMQKELRRINDEIDDERKKGRMVEPVVSAGEPLPCYFNTGCALYTEGITGIEITEGYIRLVKWGKDPQAEVHREVFYEDSVSRVVAATAGGES